MLTRHAHPLGDVLSVDDETAVLLSYFRNNVLHLFTRVGVDRAAASCNNRRMSRAGVLRLGRTMYPFLQAELFLPWDEDGFAERIDRTIDVFIREGLLRTVSEEDGGILGAQRRPERRGVPPARDRACAAAGVRALLHRDLGAGQERPAARSAPANSKACASSPRSACRLLYAPAAPEFFDKSLFRGFIQQAARTAAGVAGRQRQAGVRPAPGRVGQGRQGDPRPRTAAHDREGEPGSGEARSRRAWE